MKIAAAVARYLLGILFTVFGLNGFLQFIHQPPPTDPLALQFLIAISASHFSAFFFAVQVVAGLLLLSGSFVPLALVLLAAEISTFLPFISRWPRQESDQASWLPSFGYSYFCSTDTALTGS
jgi:putative oxidoreductase